MSKEKMSQIKDHFNEEASYYDGLILRLIPYYQEMVQALVLAIPFEKTDVIQVCDLGCGTGTISKAVSGHFPKAHITCVDMAPKMLEIAQKKLLDLTNCQFINANFYDFKFPKKFDVIISSLALHHLVSDEDKMVFYEKIFKALNSNGIFLNADVVLGSNAHLQEKFIKKWILFLQNACTQEEIEKCLASYKKEDSPAPLLNHLKWLEKIGFQDMDVIWKYYIFAVYGGKKQII